MKGTQTGWRITVLPSGSNLAWAWDPALKKYRRKTFPAGFKDAARTWAITTAAKYQLGLEHAPGGLAPTVTAASGFVAELRRRQRVEQHVDEAERVLAAFAKAVPDLAAPDAERLALEWWDNLPETRERRQEGVTPRRLTAETCNRYLVFVKAMCDHAKENDMMLARSPVGRIHKLPVDQKLKEQFTIEELRKLLRADDPYRALFALMTLAGLRIGEACGMHWEDIDWSGQVLAVRLREGVRIKRRKERLVPMQPMLRGILELRKRQVDEEQAKPWKRKKGAPPPTPEEIAERQDRAKLVGGYSVKNGHRNFRRFLERMEVPRAGRGPHSCRHTYAGLMTATGVPSIMLADYMGHESIVTTKGYARMATRFLSVAEKWKRGEFSL